MNPTDSPLGQVLDSNGTPLGEEAQRSFTVTATTGTAPNGRQKLTFRFSGNAGANEASALAYNSTLELYYLRPGEMMQFGYVCRTNEKEGSDDVALNSVAMPYYDFSGAGVEVDDTNSTVGSSPADGMYTNDGECEVISNAEAGSLGFAYSSAGENPQWLLSQVTMRRGQIQPGITKKLASRTDANDTVTQNPSFARPKDLLTWQATVENSGLYPIMDYVLSDQVQGPYGFEGKVNCQIYQPGSNWKTVGAPGDGYLFEIKREGDVITLVTPAGASKTITPNGTPVPLTVSWKTLDSYYAEEMDIQVALQKNDDGGEAIFLRFPEDRAAIPEAGGYAVLTLSTRNSTNILNNTIYMNEAYITPLAQQDWDSQVNQGNYTELETPFADRSTPTVRNSAQVAVSYGYMTSSLKAVEEVVNPENRTDSNRSPNYILLEDQGREFTYTLTVVNDGGGESSPVALDKLILIDNLPEPGDHSTFLEDDPRNSEFEVCLVENPNFQVTVTPPEGDPTTLPESQYTVEFSSKTTFGSDDWSGKSSWESEADENTRSIRVTILDDAKETDLMPAGATISLRFNARIADGQTPDYGQIAWNSFGYQYSTKESSSDLAAAPLKVGVKIPSIPRLQKVLQTSSGASYTAKETENFRFLLYQGGHTWIWDDFTEESLKANLVKEGVTELTYITLTVPAGANASEWAVLSPKKTPSLTKWTYDPETDGWADSQEPWTWERGKKYTLVELPDASAGPNGDYEYGSINNSPVGHSYTFQFDPALNQQLVCANIRKDWEIHLQKTDETGESLLPGVWFALYSPSQRDAMPDSQYQALPADVCPDREVTYEGRTYYLMRVDESQAQGLLTWSGLEWDDYLWVEVKAPEGYNLDPTIQHITYPGPQEGTPLQVTNEGGFQLPETGGGGPLPYLISGSALSAAAVLIWRRKKRTERGSGS